MVKVTATEYNKTYCKAFLGHLQKYTNAALDVSKEMESDQKNRKW